MHQSIEWIVPMTRNTKAKHTNAQPQLEDWIASDLGIVTGDLIDAVVAYDRAGKPATDSIRLDANYKVLNRVCDMAGDLEKLAEHRLLTYSDPWKDKLQRIVILFQSSRSDDLAQYVFESTRGEFWNEEAATVHRAWLKVNRAIDAEFRPNTAAKFRNELSVIVAEFGASMADTERRINDRKPIDLSRNRTRLRRLHDLKAN
jgi:hypothetical protein